MSASFQVGDHVRVHGSLIVYRIIAIPGSIVTILILNPQPNGQYAAFSGSSKQDVDSSTLEKITL
ncbi:hypothetical protein QBC46DRAFT_344275 [Diplogelasinospora grovesii]|uniref:Uncharacterized protein n=1 Tax=Diplogelasinospora grovesii TaxID=303347 RepID=A0AAN6S261_9PEZI|nr:hypothetical protein QBC46DRAFT_344275 [Diplogelasinospora grovesii]